MSAKQNPYEHCPVFESEGYLLRLVSPKDSEDLLPCYSQPTDSVITNSFNCDFGYGGQTLDEMKKSVDNWLGAYAAGAFVRWSAIDKRNGKAIGTIELFNVQWPEGFFKNCGVLRLDLCGESERTTTINEILSLLLPDAFALFDCEMITTKVSPSANERIAALKELAFEPTDERMVKSDGTFFDGFWVLKQNREVL